MQKTRIEWADMVWNPLTGCRHGCPYCYARNIANRFGGYDIDSKDSHFEHDASILVLDSPLYKVDKNGKSHIAPFPNYFEPTFHRYRLEEPQRLKTAHTVFVGSMTDLFGEWVPDSVIYEVFEACKAAPQHRYLFLTKNPARYARLELPEGKNLWFGASATDHNSAEFAFRNLPKTWEHNFFLSAEPLLGEINLVALNDWPRWIIIGAMTGPGAKQNQPRWEWVMEMVKQANDMQWARTCGFPIFMKESLLPIMGEDDMRREFPWTD